MTQVIEFKTAEKNTLLSVLNEYPLMDSVNIYNIIEDMMYENVEEYYPDGILKCKYTLRFGKLEGLYQEWYKTGQKFSESYYREGEENGLYQCWCTNGQKWIETYCLNGKYNGLYKRWSREGILLKECTYRDGEEVIN